MHDHSIMFNASRYSIRLVPIPELSHGYFIAIFTVLKTVVIQLLRYSMLFKLNH